MDDTDRKLMLLITENPRMTLRELAKRLGVSRQAVHHRMRGLTKMGVFRSMKAEVSMNYLDVPVVAVWGRSMAPSVEKALDRLGESELTISVRVAGASGFFVGGGLRNISELDGFVDFVKRAAAMPEPTVGILSFGDGINPEYFDGGRRRESYRELSAVDLKIIASLQDDARKPIPEIAKGIGVSPKTVRRHLDGMRAEGSLDFYQPWDLTSGEDFITLLQVTLRTGADKVRTARRLIAKDPLHLFLRSFSNLPSFLIGALNLDKMTEIRKILKEIGEDEDVVSVTPNLLYFERSYMPWDHKLIRTFADQATKNKGLKPRFPLRE
jgi:DNA-binding Lrp family transcriptional regulator